MITQQKMAKLECEPRLTVSRVSCFNSATMLWGRNQLLLTKKAGIVWPENCPGPTDTGQGVIGTDRQGNHSECDNTKSTGHLKPAFWPQVSPLTSLCLRFPICTKVGGLDFLCCVGPGSMKFMSSH